MRALRILAAVLFAAAGIALLLYWMMGMGLAYAFAGGLAPLAELSTSDIIFYVAAPLLALALIFLCLRTAHPEAFQRFRGGKLSTNGTEGAE